MIKWRPELVRPSLHASLSRSVPAAARPHLSQIARTESRSRSPHRRHAGMAAPCECTQVSSGDSCTSGSIILPGRFCGCVPFFEGMPASCFVSGGTACTEAFTDEQAPVGTAWRWCEQPPAPPRVPPLAPYVSPPPSAPGCLCRNSCVEVAFDGFCDDGGPGSESDFCDFGTDCADCGQPRCLPSPQPRQPPQPPVVPPPSPPAPLPPGCVCDDTCPGHAELASDGVCDDGGEGAEFSDCVPGTDCTDCGKPRCAPHAPPSSPRTVPYPPPAPPSGPPPLTPGCGARLAIEPGPTSGAVRSPRLLL